jgi:hypothetical protein
MEEILSNKFLNDSPELRVLYLEKTDIWNRIIDEWNEIRNGQLVSAQKCFSHTYGVLPERYVSNIKFLEKITIRHFVFLSFKFGTSSINIIENITNEDIFKNVFIDIKRMFTNAKTERIVIEEEPITNMELVESELTMGQYCDSNVELTNELFDKWIDICKAIWTINEYDRLPLKFFQKITIEHFAYLLIKHSHDTITDFLENGDFLKNQIIKQKSKKV